MIYDVSDLFEIISKLFAILARIAFVIGLFLGTALCICQGLGAISIGWFWATFPFWGPWVGLFVIAFVFGIISLALDRKGD